MNDLYLAHHGIKGQKWGVRRFQNPDGSLTEAGKKRQVRIYNRELAKNERKAAKYYLGAVNASGKKRRIDDKLERKKKVQDLTDRESRHYEKLEETIRELTLKSKTAESKLNYKYSEYKRYKKEAERIMKEVNDSPDFISYNSRWRRETAAGGNPFEWVDYNAVRYDAHRVRRNTPKDKLKAAKRSGKEQGYLVVRYD